MSTLRVPTRGYASPPAWSASSAIRISNRKERAVNPRAVRPPLSGDETRLGHQLPVERIILLEELQHVLTSEKDRLERLLFHVVLVFGGLRDLLEQIDVERGLVGRDLAGEEQGAQHQILDVEAFFLAGRNVVPRQVAGNLGLIFDAL